MPKDKIEKTAKKVLTDTQTANSQITSSEIEPPSQTLGKPDCPYCGGVGFLRVDVPLGHEKFGRLEVCTCRSNELAQVASQRLYELSNLNRLSHLRFENFDMGGNRDAKFITLQEKGSLGEAFEESKNFAEKLEGWLLLEGAYGCGKTHLAAAIANEAVDRTRRPRFPLDSAAALAAFSVARFR